MNKYLHVVHSYMRRPRFWIFGLCYLAIVGLFSLDPPEARICFSVLFACIVTGLGALHLRRQFATPQAHLMPDFFLPHFLVAVAASSLVWIVVPWWEAVQIHISPLAVISIHAMAPLVMAVVVLFPKAIVSTPLAPILVAWMLRTRKDFPFAASFLAGNEPLVSWGLIGLAVVGYGLAAWRLSRLSDVTVATSDDFSAEAPRSDLQSNRWMERLLGLRDAAIDRRLMRAAGRGALLATRRIPGTISLAELALFSVAILVLMPLAWFAIRDAAGAWLVMTVGTGLMLFAPFSTWRFRCNALAMEFMRPAARGSFLRQILAAMALDFCLWTGVATAVVAVGYLFLISEPGFSFPHAFWAHAAIMCALSVLLFGIGVSTLRFRAWMPLFIGLLVLSVVAAGYTVYLVAELNLRWYGNRNLSGYDVVGTFTAVCVTIGLILTWGTHRHWRTMDLT
jgi:hypothetical protein